MTCDDFQIAFEQLQAGAESAVSAAVVDAHINTCAACTAYVALSQKVSTAMSNTISLAPTPPTIEAMRGFVAKMRKDTMVRLAAPLVLYAIAAIVHLLHYGTLPSKHQFVLMGLTSSLIYVIFFKRIARLNALQNADDGEFVGAMRAELTRRIRVSALLLVVATHAIFIAHVATYGLAMPTPMMSVFIVAAIIVLPFNVIRLRRLIRERAQLA